MRIETCVPVRPEMAVRRPAHVVRALDALARALRDEGVQVSEFPIPGGVGVEYSNLRGVVAALGRTSSHGPTFQWVGVPRLSAAATCLIDSHATLWGGV